jgi:hypothetical protein
MTRQIAFDALAMRCVEGGPEAGVSDPSRASVKPSTEARPPAEPARRVIAIGGASHVGKSTLAQSLAASLKWPVVSTDKLARHPGRPWPVVPPHVAEHYLKLSPRAVFQFLLVHYDNMWPRIRDLILSHVADPRLDPIILEGSALRPGDVARLASPNVEAAWLAGNGNAIRNRILQGSGYSNAPARQRQMIDRFVSRSIMDNERIVEEAGRLGQKILDMERPQEIEDFVGRCLRRTGCAAPPLPGADRDGA